MPRDRCYRPEKRRRRNFIVCNRDGPIIQVGPHTDPTAAMRAAVKWVNPKLRLFSTKVIENEWGKLRRAGWRIYEKPGAR